MMIYFIHIHKNAGTTFFKILRHNYGVKAIKFNYHRPNYEFNIEQYRKVFKLTKNIKAITSHNIRFPSPLDIDSIKYIVFLRDPLERLLSQYYYIRQITDKSHYSHKLSFFEFYETIKQKSDVRFVNGQTLHLAKSLNAECAIEVLNKCFFVGICEQFDQSLVTFSKKLKERDFDIRYEMINVTEKKNERIDDLNTVKRSNIYKTIIEDHKLDYIVYEHARKKLNQHIKNYGPNFESELSNFRKKNLAFKFPRIKMKCESLRTKILNFCKFKLIYNGF